MALLCIALIKVYISALEYACKRTGLNNGGVLNYMCVCECVLCVCVMRVCVVCAKSNNN